MTNMTSVFIGLSYSVHACVWLVKQFRSVKNRIHAHASVQYSIVHFPELNKIVSTDSTSVFTYYFCVLKKHSLM